MFVSVPGWFWSAGSVPLVFPITPGTAVPAVVATVLALAALAIVLMRDGRPSSDQPSADWLVSVESTMGHRPEQEGIMIRQNAHDTDPPLGSRRAVSLMRPRPIVPGAVSVIVPVLALARLAFASAVMDGLGVVQDSAGPTIMLGAGSGNSVRSDSGNFVRSSKGDSK